jgi:hypothetical protein
MYIGRDWRKKTQGYSVWNSISHNYSDPIVFNCVELMKCMSQKPALFTKEMSHNLKMFSFKARKIIPIQYNMTDLYFKD